VNAAKTVKGVTTVNDQLNVVAEKSASLKGTQAIRPLPVKSKPNCWRMTLCRRERSRLKPVTGPYIYPEPLILVSRRIARQTLPKPFLV
jgi:hypothetical protein